MPDASSSLVGPLGTVDPGVKAWIVAPPPRLPASASKVVKGVIAPAANAPFKLKLKKPRPVNKQSNRQLFLAVFTHLSSVLYLAIIMDKQAGRTLRRWLD